ncbi:importin subunit alpha-1b [Panicum miliaceum]|uniref:Importin subunit alpha-1b n=1 Tax=Panicum miliaceum TaxID=4540 RepID=A0A3L6QYR7_PANMI|nr:importin subunit alpha-1b [Panicum miliaceum]
MKFGSPELPDHVRDTEDVVKMEYEDDVQKERRREPSIEEVVSSGLVPGFILLLHREDCPELQFEVERLLTTIVFGTAEETIAVPIFVELLISRSEDVREEARKQSNH